MPMIYMQFTVLSDRRRLDAWSSTSSGRRGGCGLGSGRIAIPMIVVELAKASSGRGGSNDSGCWGAVEGDLCCD